MKGKPRYGFDQKNSLTRLRETCELLAPTKNPPRCNIRGKPYVPIHRLHGTITFLVKPEELGWEMYIIETRKIVRCRLKCDVITGGGRAESKGVV